MITPSDKIKKFDSIDDLKTAIEEDLVSKDTLARRYPVRFIMLNDFKSFRQIASFLRNDLNVNSFEIQQLLPGDDKTISIDMLANAIEQISETSLVTPFSELVRFYKDVDFQGFFNQIILTEDLQNPNKRIYIPIIGLNNRFIDFLKNFGRIEESGPIWQFYAQKDDKVRVYITNFKSKYKPLNSDFCKLDTMREWLDFWQKQAPKDKLLCAARPICSGWKNSRPDSIFSFEEIRSPYEYITEFLGINIPFDYDESEDEYWHNFLDEISAKNSNSFNWTSYAEIKFGSYHFNANKVVDIWSREDTPLYDRWLLRHFVLHSERFKNNPYLRLCLKETQDYSNPAKLLAKLADRIFYVPAIERNRYVEERIKMMTDKGFSFKNGVPLETQNWINDQLVALAQKEKDLKVVKSLCTQTFDFEKALFMGWLVKRPEFRMSDLHKYYPGLYAYLTSDLRDYYATGAQWLYDYFKEYRHCKVNHDYSDNLQNFIDTYNANSSEFWDWYFKHETCKDLYDEWMSKTDMRPDKVYWIDGLGAEFIPYIQYVIETNKASGYEIIEAKVATTGLPSNTSLNKFDVDNKVVYKFGDLDAMAHRDHYKPRVSLISELDTVHRLIRQILKDNGAGKHVIAIVSDHGLSAMSLHMNACKQTGTSHHEGRYIPVEPEQAAEDTPEYITVKDAGDGKSYKVALKHYSLGKKPTHEVHGGCTPEEVLVPFIVISNIAANKPVKYDIHLKNTEIPVSNPLVECIIHPMPKKAIMAVNGQEVEMSSISTEWSALIPNTSEGKVSISITPERGKTQKFEIKVFGLGMGDSLTDFDI